MDPATIMAVIGGITTLLRVIGELEARGVELTPDQRLARDTERDRLNELWASLSPEHVQMLIDMGHAAPSSV